MVCKDQVAEILESQEFFITFCEDGVNKVRISTTQVGFNYIDVIQLDVGTHDDTYGMCISTTVYFNKDEFDKAFSMMCDIIKNSNIEVCGKTREEVEIASLGLLEVSHYTYLDAVINLFWVKVFGKTTSEMFCGGIVSAHGDKCYDYKRSMPKRGIPFNRSALLFLLTYTKEMDREKHFSEEWVVENYDKYLPFIEQAEKEYLEKLTKKA